MEKAKRYKAFPITSICRANLEDQGYDTSKVDDNTMERLTSKMADNYCGQLFWPSLYILAKNAGIPKHKEKKYQLI